MRPYDSSVPPALHGEIAQAPVPFGPVESVVTGDEEIEGDDVFHRNRIDRAQPLKAERRSVRYGGGQHLVEIVFCMTRQGKASFIKNQRECPDGSKNRRF